VDFFLTFYTTLGTLSLSLSFNLLPVFRPTFILYFNDVLNFILFFGYLIFLYFLTGDLYLLILYFTLVYYFLYYFPFLYLFTLLLVFFKKGFTSFLSLSSYYFLTVSCDY